MNRRRFAPLRKHLRFGPAGAVACAAGLVAGCGRSPVRPPPADASRRVEWPAFAGGPGGMRFSPLTDITPANVSRLGPAWSWRIRERVIPPSGDRALASPGKFEATPLMLGDTLYFTTPFNKAVALDANTGAELWRFDPGAARAGGLGDDLGGFVHRGMAMWTASSGERRLFLNSRWRLLALDPSTGRPLAGFGEGGAVDLTRGLRWKVEDRDVGNTSPPIVYRDLVMVGSSVADRLIYDQDPPGAVQAFDVRTGRPAWVWEPMPRPGEAGSETWEQGALDRVGHTNIWAPMSVDTALGLVFVPVSAASNDYYGGRRKGANLFSESLVCLDAATGRIRWYRQLTHHGLWDYDPAATPTLVRVAVAGREVQGVAIAGKTGFLYLFDRSTGQPLFPMEERSVPASDVPGEEAWPTQPVPAWPPPFARQGFGDSDLVDFTPELRAMARERIAAYRLGPIFTPPSLEGTIVMPGWIGGAGWGATAYDSANGVMYVKASNHPVLARLVPSPGSGKGANARYVLNPGAVPDEALELLYPTRTGLLKLFSRNVRVPVVRPPYGTLTAIDLLQGRIRWQVTVGDNREIRDHPALRGLNLPPLGVSGAVGPAVTASGLLFLTGGGRVLYALETAAGAEVGHWDLGREGYSVPMTYRTAAGRQYVVLATGGGDDSRLLAFALKEPDQ